MTSGYSISLEIRQEEPVSYILRDPARGTSQLFLSVKWTSAFKQFFHNFFEARSENGYEKWNFLVWNRVRIRRTRRHTPTKNSLEYPPPPGNWKRHTSWAFYWLHKLLIASKAPRRQNVSFVFLTISFRIKFKCFKTKAYNAQKRQCVLLTILCLQLGETTVNN